VLPPAVLRERAEEFAERVRDGVNSAVGSARLAISGFHDFTDDSVGILLVDSDAPDGCDRLYLGWEDGCDVDGTVEYILDGQAADIESQGDLLTGNLEEANDDN